MGAECSAAGAVGVDADVGAVLPDQSFAAHGLAEPLHVVELGELAGTARRGAQPPADFAPAFGEEVVNELLRRRVGGHLFLGEHGFELAYQVGGADDLFAQAAEEVDGAGVDHGDVHDVVIGRELHGQAARAGEHGVQAGGEFLPA
jgi:hypothetical protein